MSQGSGIGDWLRSAHNFTKKHKLASRGLRALGYNTAANVAETLGYGVVPNKPKKQRKKKK